MHTFNMSFVFHFYILGLTSWIWTNPSTEELKFESPWNETHMRDSILNLGYGHTKATHLLNRWTKWMNTAMWMSKWMGGWIWVDGWPEGRGGFWSLEIRGHGANGWPQTALKWQVPRGHGTSSLICSLRKPGLCYSMPPVSGEIFGHNPSKS